MREIIANSFEHFNTLLQEYLKEEQCEKYIISFENETDIYFFVAE